MPWNDDPRYLRDQPGEMPRNALIGQPPPAPSGGEEPEAEMERLMREAGYTGDDPEEGMRAVWEKMPTDDVAALIEMLAQKHGLTPPWGDKSAPSAPRSKTPGNSLMRR